MFRYDRRYTGPLRGLILDWAGTAVDHGCQAPVEVFVEVFARRDIPLTLEEARGPMGVHKRDHVAALMRLPSVITAWARLNGAAPTEADVQAVYDEAVPLQIEVLDRHCEPIDGVLDAVAAVRERGIRVGSTTGYTRPMLDRLAELAAERGYRPDAAVASSEVRRARPAPYLCWEAAQRIGAEVAASCVKAGDTPADVEAGLNAGFWTIGVAMTGNETGLTAAELAGLDPVARDALRIRARARLAAAGAHYVIDRVAEIGPVLDAIQARLDAGERP